MYYNQRHTETLAGSKTKTCSCARKEKKERKTRRDGTYIYAIDFFEFVRWQSTKQEELKNHW